MRTILGYTLSSKAAPFLGTKLRLDNAVMPENSGLLPLISSLNRYSLNSPYENSGLEATDHWRDKDRIHRPDRSPSPQRDRKAPVNGASRVHFARAEMRPDIAQHQLLRRKATLPASQSQAGLPFQWRSGQGRRQSPRYHESPDVWPRRPDRTAVADSRDSFAPTPGSTVGRRPQPCVGAPLQARVQRFSSLAS